MVKPGSTEANQGCFREDALVAIIRATRRLQTNLKAHYHEVFATTMYGDVVAQAQVMPRVRHEREILDRNTLPVSDNPVS